MTYSFLDHTADIRMKVTAKSMEELFTSALKGMMEILAPENINTEKTTKRTIQLSAPDSTVLLIDFLNEVLTFTHIYKENYILVSFTKLSEDLLDAEIQGIPIKALREDIKAVSFHEAEIQKNKNGLFEATIIFDI